VVIKDGKVVLEKGYGFRDLGSHAPVTSATLFNIGSISKSFTALGIAQLVDQQKADLDTPVIKYLPDLRLSDPKAEAITLRRLLSHSSGFPADEQWPQQVKLSPSSRGCPLPRRQGRGFSIAVDASSSQPSSWSGSPANLGKPTRGRTSSSRLGCPQPHLGLKGWKRRRTTHSRIGMIRSQATCQCLGVVSSI
jgi:CubicO group peptidase (beta-lactamase class C family)